MGRTNTGTALTLLSADLLGVTGRAIGLDAFRVERGEFEDRDFRDDPSLISNNRTDPTTRFTVSKRLSSQVEFTVSQNLRENGKTTFIISYFPKPNVEMRALSRDNATASLGIRHQVTFGGGVDQAAVRAAGEAESVGDHVRRRRTGDRTGRCARDQARCRRQLRLPELQRTRSRSRGRSTVTGLFRGAGADPPRRGTPNGTVALEFTVNRGPRTVLEIVGTSFLPASRRELEEAWHRNVFDQFLIDDLTHRVRRHLVGTNETRQRRGRDASIGPSRNQAAADRSDAGRDGDGGREIRFAGNQALNAAPARRDRRAGLDIEAWLDRTESEELLVTVYNEAGFLRPRSSAGR